MFNKKSNIAVFSFAYLPFEGGAEVAVREITKRIDNSDFTVFTYKFDKSWPSKESQENVEIIRLGKGRADGKKYGLIWHKIVYIFKAWQEAEKMYERRRFEAIWAIMASYGAIAALFFKLNHPRIPLLLTIQEGDSENHMIFGKLGFVGLWSKLAMRSADYIQVISKYLGDFVKRNKVTAPIEIIPNGVDLDLFDTNYKESELISIRENLGIKDEYVVTTTSRLVKKNGVDTLIDAVAKFKNKRPNIKCLIIGGGPDHKKLSKKVKKLKLDNNVLFLGQISHKDLPLYLKISDLFVRASRSEGLGNSFLEAMAAGLPVIGTPVGGIVDFLKNEQTGLFIEVNNADDLAKKMLYAVNNPKIMKIIVKNSQNLVNENYNWDKISKLFRNIFDKLINSSHT